MDGNGQCHDRHVATLVRGSDDLPQVVIAMAVTRDGIPVRCWTFPGNTQDQRRNLRHELDRMHLVTLVTADGRVAQRSTLTSGHRTILAALDLPEPPRYLDFTPGSGTDGAVAD